MIDDIRKLIAEDKIEEAINSLMQIYPQDQILIQLSGYLHDLNDSIAKGIISTDEMFRQRNIIRNSLNERVSALLIQVFQSTNSSNSNLGPRDFFYVEFQLLYLFFLGYLFTQVSRVVYSK